MWLSAVCNEFDTLGPAGHIVRYEAECFYYRDVRTSKRAFPALHSGGLCNRRLLVRKEILVDRVAR